MLLFELYLFMGKLSKSKLPVLEAIKSNLSLLEAEINDKITCFENQNNVRVIVSPNDKCQAKLNYSADISHFV